MRTTTASCRRHSTTSPASATGPLNFLYSGTDMWFQNSVHVKAPVYVTQDLHLESTARSTGSIDRAACTKAEQGRGRPRPLPQEPAEPDRPHRRHDPRIDEIHVVNSARRSRPGAELRSRRRPTGTPTIFATVHDNSSRRDRHRSSPSPRSSRAARPSAERSPDGPPPGPGTSNMGFWYQNADLGPWSPARRARCRPQSSRTIRHRERLRTTRSTGARRRPRRSLTPPASVHVQVDGGLDRPRRALMEQHDEIADRQGTIFIDGSIYIAPRRDRQVHAARHDRRLGNVRDEGRHDLRYASRLHGRL